MRGSVREEKKIAYPKTYRLPLHKLGVEGFEELPGKFYMSEEKMNHLLSPGLKFIREKMNGVSRPFPLGARTAYYEDLKIRRVIPYTQLPSYTFVYAVKHTYAEGSSRYLSVSEIADMAMQFGWHTPPILLQTEEALTIDRLISLVRSPSKFNPNHVGEGIIILNEDSGMEGKIINPEYDDKHEGVYKDLEMEVNRLA